MRNWLTKFLLSLALAFFFLQGQSHETSAASPHQSIHSVQSTQFRKSFTPVKIQTKKEETRDGITRFAHKKNRSIQKLLITDGDDDDDSDEVASSKKYITDNCFSDGYLTGFYLFYFTKDRLPFCHHLSVLSSDKHLLLCTLRI